MKIVIMGSGAMGSLFGAFLTRSGQEVWLVDPSKEQIGTISALGLTLEEKGQMQIVPIHATLNASAAGKADLVIFFVKTYQTEKAAIDAVPLEKEETLFLTMQNGLGNEEIICKRFDPKRVLLGTTGQGATLMGPGHIRHAGWGKTYIGERDHQISDRILEIAEIFSNAGIETEVSSDIHSQIWEKLLINVGINPLTALTGLKNGQILENPDTESLMKKLVLEAAEIAVKRGCKIETNPIEQVKQAIEATKKNRSSMGQDFDYRRKTEIDAINGAVVREAEKLGMSAPYNDAITHLIKIIEKRF